MLTATIALAAAALIGLGVGLARAAARPSLNRCADCGIKGADLYGVLFRDGRVVEGLCRCCGEDVTS